MARMGDAGARCPRCGEVKPVTPAHWYFDRNGRVTGYCRDGCHAAYLKEHAASGLSDEQRYRRRVYRRAWNRRKHGITPERYRIAS